MTISETAVRPARPADVAGLAVLFDRYRVFYKCDSDRAGAARYVGRLVDDGVTRFFVAQSGNGPLTGFVHLTPSYSTLAMRPMWIVEDLYVLPEARQRGIGTALLAHAERFARAEGACRLTLFTAHDNLAAQRRYAASGYTLDTEFRQYHRILT